MRKSTKIEKILQCASFVDDAGKGEGVLAKRSAVATSKPEPALSSVSISGWSISFCRSTNPISSRAVTCSFSSAMRLIRLARRRFRFVACSIKLLSTLSDLPLKTSATDDNLN